ncbi:MAG TPA: alpha/beta hydrolase [Ramlibacter sp.]|nr:alpha/beta hydrolase [Ramlibacter sp.]
MAYVTLEGSRLYYEEQGSGQPLIFIHGATQDTLSWRENLDHFGRQHRAIAIDLPGHGKSDLIQNRPTRNTDEHAAVVSRFIQALKIPKPVLVGHSMGAAISITVSLNYPDEILGVVAVDGGAAFSGAAGVNYRGNVLTDAEINPGDWLETTILSVLGRTTPMEVRRKIAFDCTRCSSYVQYSDLLTYTSFNFSARMHEAKLPVYYIVGEDDWSTTPKICGETAGRLQARGVPSGVWELKGVGHIPHTEQPEVFNRTLDEVLRKFA